MKPDDIATAITQALVQGGSQWLVATIVAFLPAMWTMTLILHLGRPYVIRTLRRCGLRLGADIWWMSYLLIRDAVRPTSLQAFAEWLPSNATVGPALFLVCSCMEAAGTVTYWLLIPAPVSTHRPVPRRRSPPQKPSPALGD